MVGGAGRNWRFFLTLLVAVAAQALIFQPGGAAADFLSPLISPLRNASCELAQCGKGTCKPTSEDSNSTSLLRLLGPGFTCECDPGWKRFFYSNDSFGFLPCVLPNCSMNYACSPETPAPPPQPPMNLLNLSFLDPCSLSPCGEGTCVKTSPLSYRCDCRPGTRNLLNLTNFPCFRDCVMGADCTNLGIGSGPSVSAPTTTTSASPPNAAIIGPKMNLLWLSILMMILLVAMA